MTSSEQFRGAFRMAAAIQRDAAAHGGAPRSLCDEVTSLVAPQDEIEVVGTAGGEATAFVSWAHRHAEMSNAESQEWERQIVEFTTVLRQLGVDADLDLFHLDDTTVDWTRFGPDRIKEKEFVFIAVSRAWTERWEGRNAPTEGAGAALEADVLKGLFQKNQGEFQRRVKVVILPGQSDHDTPHELNRLVKYFPDPTDPDSFEPLLRALTSQPRYPVPPLGDVPVLHPRVVAGMPRARRGSNTDYSRLLKELRSLDGELAKESLSGHSRGPEDQRDRLLQRRAMVQGLLDALSSYTQE
jgi:hypothetical protein